MLCCFLIIGSIKAQQISKEELIYLTREWKGERFEDGRPKVSDDLLKRMRLVTHDEAWAVMRNAGYKYQYADGWQIIFISRIMWKTINNRWFYKRIRMA